MISPLSLSAKVFSLNLLYDKAVDDTGVPATLNPFFRLYLVCPLYCPTLFHFVGPFSSFSRGQRSLLDNGWIESAQGMTATKRRIG